MSCGCSSSTPTVSYSSGASCASATNPNSSCMIPRRVATPAVTPVSYSWVPRMVQVTSGKLVVANNEDLNVLDNSFDGPIHFDAATGNVYVSPSPSATVVSDNFACETSTLFGFPLYGLDPGCREVGANPDRNIAVVRPVESDTGILFGHRHTCSSNTAMAEEVSPVEIVPGDMPDTFPDDVKLLAYRIVPAVDACTPQTIQYYNHNGVPVVEDDLLGELVLSNDDLTDTTTETFGFALWDKINGKWVLKRLTKAAFLDMIDMSSTVSTFTHIDTRPEVFFRSLPAGAAFTTVNTNYVLTSAPNYDAKYSSVMLSLSIASLGGTRYTEYKILVDGKVFAHIGTESGSDRVNNQVIVPIPASKQINIQAMEHYSPSFVAGTYGATTVEVLLDAFVL